MSRASKERLQEIGYFIRVALAFVVSLPGVIVVGIISGCLIAKFLL